MGCRMRRRVEVEWQFVVRDLAAFRRWIVGADFDGWSLSSGRLVRLRDAYYDTADWRIWRSGFALRLRRADDAVEATLKAVARARRGVAERREITSLLRDASLEALARGATRVGVRVRRSIGTATLRPLFRLRTRRAVFAVRHAGRVVAELALDRTTILARARSRRLARVEIEVKAGTAAEVARFVATIRRRRHLTIARRSKFEEGLAAARLAPPRGR
jgi:inorganic triphosphatase YgiF